MNQPNNDRINKLEHRVKKREQDRGDIVENEKLLLRLARYHRAGLQELSTRMELDIADLRERIDIIERTMATKDDIAEIKAAQDVHGEKQDVHTELLGKILCLLEKKGE